MNELRFPAGFLIGASTSAHQTEGGNVSSDWWGYEASGRLAERSGDACDSLHRWREDMQLAADAGLDAYRFSIEWARIEPADGQFSLAMVAHYERMVSFARSLGLAPVVTLHHFTNPAWFSAGGGWLRDDAVERFLRYVDVIAPVIAGAHAVVTINEPNMVAIMHRVLSGDATLATGLGGLLPTPDAAVTSRLIEVHHAVVARVRETHAGVPVGWSVANQTVQWVEGGETAALAYREAVEDVFLRAAAGDDFIGVQAYTRTVIGPSGKVAQDAPVTLTGWEVYPHALAESVRHTATVIPGVPVLVTENGIATADDAERIAYTSVALAALREVMADGVRVDGYLHWSLLDNYEWGHWGPTFGLIAVDRETFVRTPKPALAWLGALRRG